VSGPKAENPPRPPGQRIRCESTISGRLSAAALASCNTHVESVRLRVSAAMWSTCSVPTATSESDLNAVLRTNGIQNSEDLRPGNGRAWLLVTAWWRLRKTIAPLRWARVLEQFSVFGLSAFLDIRMRQLSQRKSECHYKHAKNHESNRHPNLFAMHRKQL